MGTMDCERLDDYKILERIRISNKKELLELIEQYHDRHVFSYKTDSNPKGLLSDGIDIRIGTYARVTEEFTDPFDFPDGFYKHQIFVPRNDGELCLEFIFPQLSYYADQVHICILSDILSFLEERDSSQADNISVISADVNFELKGSLTDDMYFDIYKKKDTGEEYVIVDMWA